MLYASQAECKNTEMQTSGMKIYKNSNLGERQR